MAARHHKVIVIGAGVSGLVTLKTLKQLGIECVIYEATSYHGGLWHFHPDNYGVAEFTYINVSRYNYAFSDFPFPKGPDFAHNTAIAKYLDDYVEHFSLADNIQYNTRVSKVVKSSGKGSVDTGMPVNWTVTCEHEGQQFTSTCEYLVIATGHHAKPKIPKFSGEENFKGEIIHSVKYKDVRRSGYDNKKVVLIGIGDSSVDIADNLVGKGGCNVQVSTRCGAWIFPLFWFGNPAELHLSRLSLSSPQILLSMIFKSVVTVLTGSPTRWGLNPKYDPADTHPTVSPTLIHHIQRGNVTIKPDIQEIGEDFVKFTDGSISNDVDVIIKCTGYTIHLPYMEETTRNMILNEETNDLKMYHTVFHPDIGPSLAMIGYIQPIGSLIAISEIQAQWLGQVITGGCSLPPKIEMKERIIKDKQEQANYKVSTRHTIQRHPLLYCDELASYFGAKPSITDFPQLAPRLLFSSCGAAQWTLKGPYRHNKAAELVCKTPVPAFNVIGYVSINAMVLIVLYLSIKVLFFIFGFLF